VTKESPGFVDAIGALCILPTMGFVTVREHGATCSPIVLPNGLIVPDDVGWALVSRASFLDFECRRGWK
jgi:hypothetical protein